MYCTHVFGYSTTEYASFECPVQLDIYNGCYDWVDDVDWSGGQLATEKGAVVIANNNNTDGDVDIDWSDDIVISNDLGRNEVDLMKIEVSCINPSETPATMPYVINRHAPVRRATKGFPGCYKRYTKSGSIALYATAR